jgi:glyoxylase-like metal-dependent hydrolase (beta-lactamase superfamily II)/rhodanese-related sulfurtransferase
MFFKPYYLGCLAHASYLIGGSSGEAAVIDPRRDVDEYLADADAAGLRIAHVIETHLHADFVSGHVELARRAGAVIHLGAGSGAAFPHHPVQDGDTVSLGDVTLRFLHTPGHTPEGVTVLVEVAGEEGPCMAFTGDTLFIGDVGRPDLAGGKGFTPEEMARQLYQSLKKKILPLPDAMEIWPAHGAGSACGKALSDDRVSTLGRERRTNPALRLVAAGDEEGFVRHATEGLNAAPAYFAHDVSRNREGARAVEDVLADAGPLTPAQVEEMSEDGILVLDTRSVEAFGAGHVPGAVNIPLEGKFAPWVGAILPPDGEVIVAAEPGAEPEAITRLARVGYEGIVGWLEGGIEAWRAAGGEVEAVSQIGPEELRETLRAPDHPAVLDVRGPEEWAEGHLEEAVNIPLPDLQDRADELPDGELVVLCGSGYRSSIACSLLQRMGRRKVRNVRGGWAAVSKDGGV